MEGTKNIVLTALVFGIWAMAFCASQALGQTPETEKAKDTSQKTAVHLGEVVVTATKFPTQIERVPGRITVITAEEIEETPFERYEYRRDRRL